MTESMNWNKLKESKFDLDKNGVAIDVKQLRCFC